MLLHKLIVPTALRSVRAVHLPGTPGIYNTKPVDIPNWHPPSPTDPVRDGWPLHIAPFMRIKSWRWFVGCFLVLSSGFGLPFFAVEFQMKKQNQ
uniref:Cytochrome c oxidase polypeptide VIIc n=1 Tax=Globodera pallida TaxID=36090 RepID=A0A183BNL0_GLOPA